MKPLTERIENEARRTFVSLHRNARNGYERGDCHCLACSEKVDELVDHFKAHGWIERQAERLSGVWDPAAAVRDVARLKGWV